MGADKKRTLRELLYELPEDDEEVPGVDEELSEEDELLDRRARRVDAVKRWREKNREWQNNYNRKRNRRLKWERRCGFQLKDLPISYKNCDLCGATIPLGYAQPFKHGSVCGACTLVFQHFDNDPMRLQQAAAYLNLVTEKWTHDSDAQRERPRRRDKKTGKFI